jgi:Domain of unknown function (DUF1952)
MPQVVFGGMPAWLLEAYLVELGGSQADDGGAVAGDGWRATLAQAPSGGGGIAIARVTVTIEGERAAEAMAALRKKAQRGGG